MMRMRKPKWWAVALTVLGMLVFARLGVWQLQRADYKEHLLQLFANSAKQPLRPFAQASRNLSDRSYPHVRVQGHYLADKSYLLVDQVHASRRGVEVYVPFRVAGSSRLLLVDQGFLPRAFNDELPQLPALKSGELSIEGLYAKPPPPGLKLGGNPFPAQSHWPKTSIYIDLDQIGADLGRGLYPRVLLLDPDPAVAYVRQWVPETMKPIRHRAYALQWFTFALATLVIFVVMNRKPPGKKRSHD